MRSWMLIRLSLSVWLSDVSFTGIAVAWRQSQGLSDHISLRHAADTNIADVRRTRRQISSDAFRTMFFKPPCFGRFGFFEDPFSCSHYHHCMVNGTHVRRTCMAPLQFSEERQMCAEPGTVDCPDLPDFWLAAGAAAVAASGAPAPGSHPPAGSGSTNNAIVPNGHSNNNMAPFSSAPPQASNPSHNPFVAHAVTFNSAPHPPTGVLVPAASQSWPSSLGRGNVPDQHGPAGQLGLMGGHPQGAGGFGLSRSSPADRDPFRLNDPPVSAVITTEAGGRRSISGNGDNHLLHQSVSPSSPLRAAPQLMQGISHTGGHLQAHPNFPQPVWLETSASSQPDTAHAIPASYFPRPNSPYQLRQQAHAPLDTHELIRSGPTSGQSGDSLYASAGRPESMTGLLTSGPETPPDAVLDQMATMSDPSGRSTAGVQKVIANLMKSEAAFAPAFSAALMQREISACALDQKGFFADQVNHCQGYYFCSPFGDRAEFNCPAGRFFSEKTVSCEAMEQSSCSSSSNFSPSRSHISHSAEFANGQVPMKPNHPILVRSSAPANRFDMQPNVPGLDHDLLSHLRRPAATSWSDAIPIPNPFLTLDQTRYSQPYSSPVPIAFNYFGSYLQPNAIQASLAKFTPIKLAAPLTIETVIDVGLEEKAWTNQSSVAIESNLRNAWKPTTNETATRSDTPASSVSFSTADRAPTINKTSGSEEMLAVESKAIPMANSISRAFDQARNLEARQSEERMAGSLGHYGKNQRPYKFAGSRRVIDVKLMGDLVKN